MESSAGTSAVAVGAQCTYSRSYSPPSGWRNRRCRITALSLGHFGHTSAVVVANAESRIAAAMTRIGDLGVDLEVADDDGSRTYGAVDPAFVVEVEVTPKPWVRIRVGVADGRGYWLAWSVDSDIYDAGAYSCDITDDLDAFVDALTRGEVWVSSPGRRRTFTFAATDGHLLSERGRLGITHRRTVAAPPRTGELQPLRTRSA